MKVVLNHMDTLSLVLAVALGICISMIGEVHSGESPINLCGRTLHVGVRTDAPPFAYLKDTLRLSSPQTDCGRRDNSRLAEYGGFTVAICDGFLEELARECDGEGEPVTIIPVPVSISMRDAIIGGEPGIDLLCGATTASVTLRALLPTSPYTFLTGTALLVNDGYRQDGTCRVGVIRDTTADAERNFALEEVRLPGWSNFSSSSKGVCAPDEKISVHYPDTVTALADMMSEDPSADLFIDDLHILQWALDNFHLLPDITLRDGHVMSFSKMTLEERSALRQKVGLLTNIISVEPYAVVGSTGKELSMAYFSRYLTDLQKGTKKLPDESESSFRGLLAQCFGSRVDRNLNFLIEFQANIRQGDFPRFWNARSQ